MAQKFQNFTLYGAISKIIWNLRSFYQSKIKCSPFEIYVIRKPNTIWKQLASGKPSNASLDKAKSILCKEKARDWNAVGRGEDGYKDTEITKKNQTSLEKGYESGYPSPSNLRQNTPSKSIQR